MGNSRKAKKGFLVLIEKDEDNMLVASVPALNGCHTQAKDLQTLMKRIKEAIQLCLECQNIRLPRLRFVGIQEVDV